LVIEKHADKRKPTDELLNILADNVRRLRKENDLTQEALGERCEFHPTFISLIERKQRNVTISTLEIISNALNVKPSVLLREHE
jgi:transcriptional regulator with XRE-family HTH domain